MIDPLPSGSQTSVRKEEIMRCIHIALLCAQFYANDRPTMATVVLMLNSSSLALPEPSECNSSVHDRSLQISVNEDSISELSPI